MAFTVTFYKISDTPNTLDKTLTTKVGNQDGYSCNPFESVGGLNGQILLDYTPAIETANYCYISADTGGRNLYCYVRNFTRNPGGHMTVILEIDPLMTNKDEIEDCDIIVTRCSYESGVEESFGYNSFLADPMIPIIQTTRHFSDHEGNSLGVFENESYVGWNSNFFVVTVG